MPIPPGPIPPFGAVRPSRFPAMDPRFLPPSARIQNPGTFGALPDLSELQPATPRAKYDPYTALLASAMSSTEYDPPVEAPPPEISPQVPIPLPRQRVSWWDAIKAGLVDPMQQAMTSPGEPKAFDAAGLAGGVAARGGVAAPLLPDPPPGPPVGASPRHAAGFVGGAPASSGVAAASSPGKHPGLPDGMTPWDAAGFGGGASALGGLVAGTNPDPHAGMPALDEAVRQFNEALANMPPWMFAPGGFWGQQQARINFERGQARQDANDWINQQLGQRMPGGMPRSPEGRRLDLSADPRYRAQFPQAAPAQQIDQGLVDQANAAAPQIGAGGFIHVGPNSGLEPLRPEAWEAGPRQDMSPAAAADLRARQLRQRLASDPQYQEWKAAAQAAGADAMAKGLPGPQLKGPIFVGNPFPSEADQARFKAAADAFANRRADRRQRVLDQMERNRAAAAIRSLRDPQTRNAVLAAGLFGGQMPENAAIALAMMGHPDAARLFSQSRIAAQESADRRYVADKGLEGQQWIAYNRDLENWREEQKEYNKQINDMIARGDAATREDAEYLLGRQGITLRPRPTPPGQAEPGASAGPQLPEPAAPEGQSQPPQANNETPKTRQDEVILGNELRSNAKDLNWFVKNYQRLQRLPKEKRAQILRDSITTEEAEKFLDRVFIEGRPEAEAAKELGEIFGIKVKTVYDESVPWAY